LRIDKRVGVILIGFAVFLMMQPVILFNHFNVLDEIDYWMGTFCLVLFVAIESVVFAWLFGMDKGWEEMHLGADLQVPRVFYYVMKYITPTFAVGLVAWFAYDGLLDKLMMKGVKPEAVPYLWIGRVMILMMAAFIVWGVWYAWQTHPKFFDEVERDEDQTS